MSMKKLHRTSNRPCRQIWKVIRLRSCNKISRFHLCKSFLLEMQFLKIILIEYNIKDT